MSQHFFLTDLRYVGNRLPSMVVNRHWLRPPTLHQSSLPTPLRLRKVFLCRFWATVCKTLRPMLSDHRHICLSVCDVGACIVAKRLDGSR